MLFLNNKQICSVFLGKNGRQNYLFTKNGRQIRQFNGVDMSKDEFHQKLIERLATAFIWQWFGLRSFVLRFTCKQ